MSFTQCLVIGANRGIGYEFVQQLKPNHKVFATYRDSNSIEDLEELASEKTIRGRLELVHLDMGDDASCKTAAKGIKDKAGGLDLLIVNAGINSGTKKPLLEEEINELNRLFNGNVLGPLRICQAFAPLLKDRPGQSKLLLMSSEAGSLTTSKHGRSPPYAISKAGLNMMGRKLTYELESSKVAVGILHPGWVQTKMGGPNAEISAKESVSGMLKVIDRLDMSNSGEFWVYDGKHHDW